MKPVGCPFPVLSVASWPAYRFLRRQVRWSGIPISWRLFQFVVIHMVKGFGVVSKAQVDVFLELSCFFYDPLDVGNLISGFLCEGVMVVRSDSAICTTGLRNIVKKIWRKYLQCICPEYIMNWAKYKYIKNSTVRQTQCFKVGKEFVTTLHKRRHTNGKKAPENVITIIIHLEMQMTKMKRADNKVLMRIGGNLNIVPRNIKWHKHFGE